MLPIIFKEAINGRHLLTNSPIADKIEISEQLARLNPGIGFVFTKEFLRRSIEARSFRAVVIVSSWCNSKDEAVRMAKVCFDHYIPFTIVNNSGRSSVFLVTSQDDFSKIKSLVNLNSRVIIIRDELDESIRDIDFRIRRKCPHVEIFSRFPEDLSVDNIIEESGKDEPSNPNFAMNPYFVFMEEFRKSYKEQFPNNKSVSVGQAGFEKWLSMSDELLSRSTKYIEEELAEFCKRNAKPKTSFRSFMSSSAGFDIGNTKGTTLKEAGNMLSVKREAGASESDSKGLAEAAMDPKKPKTSSRALMENFKKTYKEKFPNNKSVSAVGEADFEKWLSMSDEDQAPFIAKAGKRKTKYINTKLGSTPKNDRKELSVKREAGASESDSKRLAEAAMDPKMPKPSSSASMSSSAGFDIGNTKGTTLKEAGNLLSVKKKVDGNESDAKRLVKAAKDPDKSKTLSSASMENFKKTYKEKFPNNKSVSVVGKAGGDNWQSMSDAEKAPSVAKAETRKTEHNKKTLQTYHKKLAKGNNEEESDKSKSEINDEEESDEEEDGE